MVLAISPAFATLFSKTIVDLPHAEVIRQVLAGIEEQEVTARIIRLQHSADLALMAHTAAKLSGSGIGIGILARGTAMIHQRDLPRLSSLELFPQSPLLTLETYRSIGSNAAQYAKGESPEPVPTLNDQDGAPPVAGQGSAAAPEGDRAGSQGGTDGRGRAGVLRGIGLTKGS